MHWFQKQRLATQLSVLAVFTLLVITIFLSVAASQALKSFQVRNEEYVENLTAQLKQTVTNNYSTFSKIVRLASYNSDVQSFLINENENERFTYYTKLTQNLSDFATLNAQILDIVIIDSKGKRYNLSDAVYVLPAMDLTDNALHISNLERNTKTIGAMSYFVIAKEVRSIDRYAQTNQLIGQIYLILAPNAFTGTDEDTSVGDTHMFLCDGNDKVIWSNNLQATQDIYDDLLVNPKKYTYHSEVPLPQFQGYRIVACQTAKIRLWDELNQQTGYVLILLAGIIFLLMIWSLWLRNLLRPMKDLTKFVDKIEQSKLGGLSERMSLSGYKEIELVSAELNNMLHQIHTLTKELFDTNANLYESELLAKQSEFLHLRSQINPHFLYNTLETMVGIAYSEGQPEIAQIARSLGVIFKYSIKGEDVVPLKSELKIARNYIHIQHFRFSDRFETVYDIDDDCLADMTPKMILQPLIENAIVHGIEQAERFCKLTITAHHSEDKLLLTVTDNGAGIAPDVLKVLKAKLGTAQRADSHGSEHIGVLNVNSRLKLMHGSEYGLSIDSEIDRGTSVKIILPCKRKDDARCIK